MRRAIDRLKADCAMVGIDIAQSCPELSMFASKERGLGVKSEGVLWETSDDDLVQIIAGMGAKCKRAGHTPATLRLTAVRRAT